MAGPKLTVGELDLQTPIGGGGGGAAPAVQFSTLSRVLADGTVIAADETKLAEIFIQPTTATGTQQYTSYGSYSWVCPEGVFDVSVVCIGAGGGGYDGWANPAGGGAGLGWKNDIPVVPGTTYSVQVGEGGYSYNETGANAFGGTFRTEGGVSYFKDATTVAGYGGGNQSVGQARGPSSNQTGGGFVGDGGGAGGHANNYQGGGGAGGYGGRGGNGTETSWTGWNTDLGGAGGGSYYSSTYGTGAGGGTGLSGAGPINGNQPFYNPFTGYNSNSGWGNGGSGRAGGANGMYGENPFSGTGQSSSNIQGGNYGGGGGGPGTSWPSASGRGGGGGVRIIWAPNKTRSYPSNAT